MPSRSESALTRREAITRARRSPKFRRWGRGRILVHVKFHEDSRLKHHDSPAVKSPAEERHYSPTELASTWGLRPETIRQLFENESGVIVLGNTESRRKRRYRTFRIPESVVFRVHKKIATP
jgi:hypothetical protein